MIFEWDKNKADKNLMKHDVLFEEALTIWNDEYAIMLHDNMHSDFVDRYIMIGFS